MYVAYLSAWRKVIRIRYGSKRGTERFGVSIGRKVEINNAIRVGDGLRVKGRGRFGVGVGVRNGLGLGSGLGLEVWSETGRAFCRGVRSGLMFGVGSSRVNTWVADHRRHVLL